MAEKKQGNGFNIFLVVLMAAVLILGVSNALAPKVKVEDVQSIVNKEIAKLSFPTVQEIAAETAKLIVVPEVVIPEIVVPTAGELDNDRLNDIYDETFKEESNQLKADALAACVAEFDEDDFEDFLKDSIVGFDVLNSFDEDDDEQETTIQNLGLEDNEDKLATVYQEFKIKYETDSSYDKLKNVVTSTGAVTFDEEDGFECKLVFALK